MVFIRETRSNYRRTRGEPDVHTCGFSNTGCFLVRDASTRQRVHKAVRRGRGISGRRARARWPVCAAILVTVISTGCGSAGLRTTTVVPGGAPVRAGQAAPAYCKSLTTAKALLGLNGAFAELGTSRDVAARSQIGAAAAEVSSAANHAPSRQRHALQRVASAFRMLAMHGLSQTVAVRPKGSYASRAHCSRTMQISCQLRLVGVVISLLLSVALVASAQAGVDPGLCRKDANSSRAKILPDFGVAACFGGSKLVLRNTTKLVLKVSRSGDVSAPISQRSGLRVGCRRGAVALTRSDHLPPDDKLSFHVGAGAGTVAIRNSSDNGFYAIATTVAALIPFKPGVLAGKATAIVQAVTAFTTE